METDFFNFQLGSIISPYYSQGGFEDSESSILETLQNDFSYEPSAFESSASLWDTEGELSSDIPTLNMGSLDGPFSRMDSGYKEDFHKLLTDWNEHLGSLQVSDEEEIDVKEMVKISEKLPEDIFDDSLERRVFSSSQASQGRKRGKRVIKSDVKLERSSEGRTDVDGVSQIECKGIVENMMSLREPEVKIPSFADDGLLFVPEQPDFLFGECEEDESVTKSIAVKDEPESGRGSPDESIVEIEEDCVDVETVSGPVPVLQAGDLTSLLEQFEASEAVNGATSVTKKVIPLSPANVSKSQATPMPFKHTSTPINTSNLKGDKGAFGAPMPNTTLMSNQKIRDSLPIEIIEKIKACGRKKPIAVIPAMPSKRSGQRGTRMQDAGATLSRNKLLKIVSGGQLGGGESVQLDHDYCSSEVAPPPPSFYHSDASEYTAEGQTWRARRNRKEQNNPVGSLLSSSTRSVITKSTPPSHPSGPQAAPQLSLGDRRLTDPIKSSSDRSKSLDVGCCYEKNSKKDSGLESGEVSDAGEEAGSCPSLTSRPIKRSPGLPEDADNTFGTVSALGSQDQKQKPKRKLNLQEYRSRREELEKQKVLPSVVPLSEIPVPKEVKTDTNEPIGKVDVTESGKGPDVKGTIEVIEDKIVIQSENSEKPKMQSVEIQTRCGDEGEESAVEKDSSEDQKRAARSRDLRQRSYRSSHHQKRNGSSSSVSSTLSLSSYGSASSCSSRSSSTSSLHQGRRRHRRHHHDYHSCHCRSSRPHKSCCRSSRPRSAGKSGSRHVRRSSPSQRGHSQVNSPASLTSRGSSPSSSLRSATPPSSLSPSPRRGDGRQARRRSRRSHKDSEGIRRSHRSHSCSPSWSSDCSSCYSRSRSPLHGSQHRAKFSGGNCGTGPLVLPPSSDWQPGIEREKIRQVEERRVIYVGRLTEGTTKADLRHRFEVFGPIIDISVHFREHGDNYGFVTFAYKVDAYEAVEHGNDDPSLPKYDLCFGGRRAFCKVRYSDLDAMNPWPSNGGYGGSGSSRGGDDSFDALLREAQAKLRKRKV